MRISYNNFGLNLSMNVLEGKYVSVTSAGELIGRAEAVAQRETWEPIFQDVCDHAGRNSLNLCHII